MAVKLGDVYLLGEHKLVCGDCQDPLVVKKLIGDNHVSLLLTDPPYGVAVVESKAEFSKSGKNKAIINDQTQSNTQYAEFTKGWLQTTIPYLSRKNSVYIFNSDKMLFALREGMLVAGMKFAQLLIWVKNHGVIGRLDYVPQHELIAYGWYGTHAFHKSKDKSVLLYPKPNKSPLHPTMKPVGLLRNLILNSSQIGDWVYDPFAGSGSTLIACEQTKRQCLSCEMDPDYCQVILKRFEKVTGIKPRKV